MQVTQEHKVEGLSYRSFLAIACPEEATQRQPSKDTPDFRRDT